MSTSELNKHQLRFAKDINHLLAPHKESPVMQRIQLWIRAKTNGQGLSAFIVGPATDEAKTEVMDALEALLKKQDWSVLPPAPNGQTEVAQPREVSKRPAVAPEPKAEPVDEEEEDEGEADAQPSRVSDGIGSLIAGLTAYVKQVVVDEAQRFATPQPSNDLTIAQVQAIREIVREEVRKTFAGLFDTK